MFAVGDLVVYGGEGVCRVESIGPSGLRYDGGDKTYYHLAPLYRSGTVMTPVDTAVMMRPIISRDRAMELIAAFEKSPRGIYGGAAGYFSYTGDMDFAIVIRTMVLEKGKLMMRAGAGIVADSDPIKEFQETVNKSKAVFAAAQFATTL